MPIANRASRPGGFTGPVQIRAQILREKSARAYGGNVGLTFMPLPPERPFHPAGAEGPGQWQDEDVTRAIASAEEAGLRSYRVELARDGRISIVVDSSPEAPPDAPAGNPLES